MVMTNKSVHHEGTKSTKGDENKCNLIHSPHPFLAEAGRTLAAIGYRPKENLLHFLHRGEVDSNQPIQVVLNDKIINRSDWHKTRVKKNDLVQVRSIVRGGDSDVMTTVLTIAVLVAAQQYGPAVAEAMGVGVTVGGAMITMGGMYLVSQLNKPPAALNDETVDSPNYSIRGGSNRARLYQPLQLVIGTHRVYPDMGALPYTSLEGEDQYLHQVFNFGLSDITLSDFKIGDTDLTSFDDYELQESGADGALSLFPGNVDSLAGAELVLGDWVQFTSSIDADRLQVDLSGMIFYAGDKNIEQLRVTINVEYRAVGDVSWLPFVFNFRIGSIVIPLPGSPYFFIHGSREPFRASRSMRVASGQYEVRCRFSSLTRRVVRTNWVPSDYDPTVGDYEQVVTYPTVSIDHKRVTVRLNWDQLKTYQPDTANYAGQKRIALDIRANSQLNGVIDALNAIATAQCEVWTGTAWVTGPTSNPAWWYRHIANGKFDANGLRLYGAGYPDATLDLDAIKAWGLWCDVKGLTVNLVFDQGPNCYSMLSTIARAGRASLSWGTGKLGVVYDAAGQPSVAVFGMSNIRAGSFKVSYISGQLPDEIILNWINPALGYKQDTVRQSLPGVLNPVNPVTVDIPGITNEAQAGRECNLIAAEQVYRVRNIVWETDMEGLAVSRGNVITLSHDLNQWGYSGRLLSATAFVLQLDKKVIFTPGQSHFINIRNPSGSEAIYPVNIQLGEADTITLSSPMPSAPDDDINNKPIDYIWCFDAKATPGKQVKITDIKPVSEHRVRITATDEDDAYYLAENDTYTHLYLTIFNLFKLSIYNLSIETHLIRAGAGYAVKVALAWDANGEYGGAYIRAGFNDAPLKDVGKTLERHFTFDGPENAKVTVEVVAFTKKGHTTHSSRATGSLVYIGQSQPPQDPTGLTVNELSDGTRQLLPHVTALPADFAGFLFRARLGNHATWDDLSIAEGGLDLHNEPVKAMPWETALMPAGGYTLGVKLKDMSGNESTNAFIQLQTLGDDPGQIAVKAALSAHWDNVISHPLQPGRYDKQPLKNAYDWATINIDNNSGNTTWYKVAEVTHISPHDGFIFKGTVEWGGSGGRYLYNARVLLTAVTSATEHSYGTNLVIASTNNDSGFNDSFRWYRVDNGSNYTWTLYVKLNSWTSMRMAGEWHYHGSDISQIYIDDNQTEADSLGSAYAPAGVWLVNQYNYEVGADVTQAHTGGSSVNVANYEYSVFEAIRPTGLPHGNGTYAYDTAQKYFGLYSLRLSATANDNLLYLGTGYSDYNIKLSPNKKWIVSAYVRSSSANAIGQFFIRTSDGLHHPSVNFNTVLNTWTRVSGVIDLTASDETSAILRLDNDGGGGVEMWFDGIMIEEQVGDLTEPSAYSYPSVASGRLGVLDTVGTSNIDDNALTTVTRDELIGYEAADGYTVDNLGDNKAYVLSVNLPATTHSRRIKVALDGIISPQLVSHPLDADIVVYVEIISNSYNYRQNLNYAFISTVNLEYIHVPLFDSVNTKYFPVNFAHNPSIEFTDSVQINFIVELKGWETGTHTMDIAKQDISLEVEEIYK